MPQATQVLSKAAKDTGDAFQKALNVKDGAQRAARNLQSVTGNGFRLAESSGASQSYTIVKGDTLLAICRRYYGKFSAAYYNALTRYSGIQNPHLIYPGTT